MCMAQDWQAFPSGSTIGAVGADRPYVDPEESIGTPLDAPATDLSAENSAFSLLKGMASMLSVPDGIGVGQVNDSTKVYPDLLATLGDPSDPPANYDEDASAISLMKGLLQVGGFV